MPLESPPTLLASVGANRLADERPSARAWVMDHEVRRIRPGEWRQYRQLRLEALKDSPLAFVEQHEESVGQSDQFWKDRVNRHVSGPMSAMFVAEAGGQFVGKASCFVEPDVTDYVSAHVVGVYVTPPFRGRQVADEVMAAVVQWAREDAGAARIRLFVMETNDRAAAFYRRIGFDFTGFAMAYPPNPSYTELEMASAGT